MVSRCKDCGMNFPSFENLQNHQENVCIHSRHQPRKTANSLEKKNKYSSPVVERLVLPGNEDPMGHQPYDPSLEVLLARSQQLEQQKQNHRRHLTNFGENRVIATTPTFNPIPRTVNTARVLKIKELGMRSAGPRSIPERDARVTRSDCGNREPAARDFRQIRYLREEYLKNGGQKPEVLNQMRKLEIEAKLQADRQYTEDLEERNRTFRKESDRGGESWQFESNDLDNNAHLDEVSSPLAQQLRNLDEKHDKLLSELNKLQLQMCQVVAKSQHKDDEKEDLEAFNRQHQRNLLLLQQKTEIVKQHKELERHQRELEEIMHGNKLSQPVVAAFNTRDKYGPSYNTNRNGLVIQYNYIDGLHPEIDMCRLLLHWFSRSIQFTLMDDVTTSPIVVCSLRGGQQQHQNYTGRSHSYIRHPGFVSLEHKQIIPSSIHCPDLCIVAEIQVSLHDTEVTARDNLMTQAWTRINIFDSQHQPLVGKFSVPLKSLPVNAKLSPKEFDALTQFNDAELYYQIQRADHRTTPSMLFDKSLNRPAFQDQDDSPRIRTKSRALPPPSATPPDSRRSQYSLQLPNSDTDMSSFGFVIYWLKGAEPMEGKLTLTALNPLEKKISQSALGPVSMSTDYTLTDFRYGLHMFGCRQASFQDVPVHKEMLIIAKFYQKDNSKGQQHKNDAVNENLVAWAAMTLLKKGIRRHYTSGLSLDEGCHTLKMYSTPLPDLEEILTSFSSDGRDRFYWPQYGQATLKIRVFPGSFYQSTLMSSDSETDEECEDKELSGPWFIYTEKQLPSMKQFTAGDAFDVYIDSCCFLPGTVLYTRVTGRIMDRNYKNYAKDFSAMVQLDSDVFNPVFSHKEEFREPNPPVTSTLVLKVYSGTTQPPEGSLVLIGFAAINIFVELESERQPIVETPGTQISLNEGAHQLRLYQHGPDGVSPVNSSYFSDHSIRPIPCASILIRICSAPKNDRGIPLQCDQVLKSKWAECGLWVEAPHYTQGVYVSNLCVPTRSETKLFPALFDRPPQLVKDILMTSAPIHLRKQLKKSVKNMEKYVWNNLIKGLDKEVGAQDMNKICQYCPRHGIKLAVDGASNLQWSGFTLAHVCLNPPAIAYMRNMPFAMDKLKFVEKMDPIRSSHTSPIWNDGFQHFSYRTYHPFLTVVIHLREVRMTLGQEAYNYTLNGEAWTVAQVFSGNYAITEPLQLPLFFGAPPEDVLQELTSNKCYDCIQRNIERGKIEQFGSASVFVRLCDARRSGELAESVYKTQQIPTNISYLTLGEPKNYSEEKPGDPISLMVPVNRKPEQFFKALAAKFRELIHKTLTEPS